MKTSLRAIIIVSSWFLVLSANTIRVPKDQHSIQAGNNAAFPGNTALVAAAEAHFAKRRVVTPYQNLTPKVKSSILSGMVIRVPQDQPSIQAGINAALNGDTVLVADSTYYENINFMGKAITVASYYIMDQDTNHINSTIIDGSQPSNPNAASVVSFVAGEDTNSVIYGFTITGGTGTLYNNTEKIGGGIYCQTSGAKISHNKIISNSINHTDECDGGGIGCWPLINASARYVIIEDNVIESNTITSSNTASFISGGGIFILKGRVTGNTIRYNSVLGQPIFAGGGGIEANCEDTATRTLVVISGNIITDNQAVTPVNYGGWGGGIDVVFCNVQILDNLITNNQVGGNQGCGAGVRLWRSKNISILRDNIISFNTASGSTYDGIGGGLMHMETSGITVQNNSFENNTSEYGGAIFEQFSTGDAITGNEFVNNSADTSGGALYFVSSALSITENIFRGNQAKYSGAIFDYSGNYQITNNTFVQNKTRGWGGAIFSLNNSTGNITGNDFLNNQADSSGGACYLHKSNLILTKNLFKENSAKYGGGLLDYFGNYQITNNIFVENHAHRGGGIFNGDSIQNHTVQMINNTITGNTADTAGAIVCDNAKVILMNTICWGNTSPHGQEIEMWGGTLSIANSNVQFGQDNIAIDSTATIDWQTGNIDADPQFEIGDTLYHLSSASLCINVGIDSLLIGGVMYYCPPDDYEGDERPYMGSFPDIGADETQIPPVGIEPQPIAEIPRSYALEQNYPNPFNPTTNIGFQIADFGFVSLKIYDVTGRDVDTLVSEKLPAGKYKYDWDASNLASGVYFYRLEAGRFIQVRKMLLVR